MAVKSLDVAALGRHVALHQDLVLGRLDRPSPSERLAAVHWRRVAVRRPAHAGAPARWAVALAACAAAVALGIGALRGGLDSKATADVAPASTATSGAGGMDAASRTSGHAGAGG